MNETLQNDNDIKIFSINKQEFSQAISDANSIINKKSPIQSITNIHIHKEDNKLILSATNLDVLFIKQLEANFETDFSYLLLKAGLLVDCLKRMSGDDVDIFKSSTGIIVKNNALKFNLLNSEDKFPTRNLSNFEKILEIHSDDLKKLINVTDININEKEMGHIKLCIDDQLSIIFFDRKRLSFTSQPIQASKHIKFLINMKFIKEISKLKGNLSLLTKDNEILFCNENTNIVSKTVQGYDIDHKQFVKDIDNYYKAIIKSKDFRDAVSNVSPTCSDITRNIKLHLNNNNIELSTFDPTLGSSQTNIECENTQEVVFHLNIDFLANSLSACDTEFITFYFKDKLKQIIIQSTAFYIIMPIRTND